MGDNQGGETSRSCKRQRVCEEEAEDRISSLPDSILIHILSFLSTQDAVRTVLVPRFRNLWNFLSTLTFDHSGYFPLDYNPLTEGPFYHENFLKFVRHVLILHKNATIDKFALKFGVNLHYYTEEASGAAPPGYYYEEADKEQSMAREVDSWIHFAIRKKVKVLDLDFYSRMDKPEYASYRLPSVVFRGKYLTELKLVSCEIKPSGQIRLNCLKRLFMESVVLNNEIIDRILSGCSVLEEVTLRHCYGLGRLAFRNPSIKNLTVFQCDNNGDNKRLEISCPNIESLHITGCLDLVDLVDVSSVAVSSTVFLFLEHSHDHERYRTIKAMFEKLSGCMMFRPCARCILVFTKWQQINEPNLLFKWKYLEFELCLEKWFQPGISCLLRTSRCLETLAMYISNGCDQILPLVECPGMESYDFDDLKFWRSQEGDFHCLKYHLKTIKIYGDITQPHIMDIIKFLLKHAMVLEILDICTRKTFQPSFETYCCRPEVELTTEQRLEMSQKLLSLPRASSKAVISVD